MTKTWKWQSNYCTTVKISNSEREDSEEQLTKLSSIGDVEQEMDIWRGVSHLLPNY